MRDKLMFVRDGGAVQRFHTVRVLCGQTVAEHSFGVAWLLWFLTDGEPSAALLMAALAHDVAEHMTGDMPAPAKRSMGIRTQFASAEEAALRTAGIRMSSLSDAEVKLLKIADITELMLTCIDEMRLGNRSVKVIYNNCVSYLEEMHPLPQRALELLTHIGEMYHDACK